MNTRLFVTDLVINALRHAFSEGRASKIAVSCVAGAAGRQNSFRKVSQREAAHVALLQSVLGGSAVAKRAFNFTVGGARRWMVEK